MPVGARYWYNAGSPIKALQAASGLGMNYPDMERGVPNPYTVHVHPYPTRYHGGIYTRPVFGLPYVQSPQSVFKPDDFYDYYGVSGLGSVGGSSLGWGVGGNTLGLGATGTPIYYYAKTANPKVTTLQEAANKVLVANGYLPIKVTGIMEATTCGALGLCAGYFLEEIKAQAPYDLLEEAARTCRLAVQAGAKPVYPAKNPNPVQPLTQSQPTVVMPPATVPEVAPPAPAPATAAIVPVPTVVQPVIEQVRVPVEPPPQPAIPPETPAEPPPMVIPGMTVDARPTEKAFGVGSILLVALGGGALWYYMSQKKGRR